MKTADFDFFLPRDLIALRPSAKRDESRLLVLHGDGLIEHRGFPDIVEYMDRGDLLLLNNTKVFPARIFAHKPDGTELDILMVRETDEDGLWEILHKGRFLGPVTIGGVICAEIRPGPAGDRKKYLSFRGMDPDGVRDMLWQHGFMPLPPYIKRMPDDEDRYRYQTVYAENEGSIAAPTAGLHFTEELLKKAHEKGISVRALTLHVGTGTFKPIKSECPEKHSMDPEYAEFALSLIDEIRLTRERGNKLIAVGTTATRALEGFMSGVFIETVTAGNGNAGKVCGYTDIFIRPGYKFKTVDSLITNFHLPCSTPLLLASALCGFDNLRTAYEEAVAMGYRFFSYGDAMLIL